MVSEGPDRVLGTGRWGARAAGAAGRGLALPTSGSALSCGRPCAQLQKQDHRVRRGGRRAAALPLRLHPAHDGAAVPGLHPHQLPRQGAVWRRCLASPGSWRPVGSDGIYHLRPQKNAPRHTHHALSPQVLRVISGATPRSPPRSDLRRGRKSSPEGCAAPARGSRCHGRAGGPVWAGPAEVLGVD